MSKATMSMDFERYGYSDDAVNQVIDQAPGKPFLDENRRQIGIVEKATRIENTKVIEFEIEVF